MRGGSGMIMHLDQHEIHIITMITAFVLIVLQLEGTIYMSGCHTMMAPPLKLHINDVYINTFKLLKITPNFYSRKSIIL